LQRELVNITPLIDVVFILLVLFMLAGIVKPKEALPVDPTRLDSEIRGGAQDIVVLIDAAGRIAIGDRVLTRDELTGEIGTSLSLDPGLLIQLKPGAAAEAILVIDAMEAIRDA
jgi:biopolymer transport protein ExbD